jgi:hypothetical protein
MNSHSIEDYRRRNEDAPLHLVRESWSPVVRLIDGWPKKLGRTSGYSSQELDDFSRTHAVRFPRSCANGGAWPAATHLWKSACSPPTRCCLRHTTSGWPLAAIS